MLDRRTSPLPLRLDKNLAALGEHSARLAERIAWTTLDATVDLGMENTSVRLHQAEHALVIGQAELTRAVSAMPEADEVFVFGIGLGEQLAHFLLMRPETRVTAWERDPALLRQALSERDFTRFLSGGRLSIALGADIVTLPEHIRELPRLEHPLVASRYGLEARLLAEGLEGRRIALGMGGVIVDQVGEVLNELGCCVLPLELARWTPDEHRHARETYDPEAVILIDHDEAVEQVCEECGVELLVWEVNPIPARPEPSERVHIFTVDRSSVEDHADAGRGGVQYLPVGSRVTLRRKLDLTTEELEAYGAPVCFAGSSLETLAQAYRRRLLALYGSWHADGMNGLGQGEEQLEHVLAAQRADYSRDLVPALMAEHFGEFMAAARRIFVRDDPEILVGEIVASERRIEWVRSLGKHGIHVWGDPYWKTLEPDGVVYKGRAHNTEELTRVYNGGQIHVDIGRLYLQDIVTLRAFDTLACGGFLITERTESIEELFEIGVELEGYGDYAELEEKVSYYRANPEAAQAIAERGARAVHDRHSLRDRMQQILDQA